MGKVHPAIEGRVRDFIESQHLFFVATAPLAAEGHVNVSPKGVDGSFVVVDEHTVAYLDITASGAETIAHLRENGRITLMFTSFGASPTVVRLHGRGRVIRPDHGEYAAWATHFPKRLHESPATRAVIVVHVDRVSDSCGYAVPFYEYVGGRDLLVPHVERKGVEGIAAYQREKTATSIDGLPALGPPTRS